MKSVRVFLAAACIIGAAACGDDSPTAPSNQPLRFTADLRAASEVPPVSGTEAGASGTATITITPTRDTANAITGGTTTFSFNVAGLTPTSSIILALIHTGAAGVVGAPIVNTGLSAATAIATPAGTASFQSASPVTTDATVINNIVANLAAFYFNVHTTSNPGGVARGQLVRVQ